MTLDEQHLLQTLIREKAEIYSGAFGDIYAAYPGGSRRRKPVCWIEKETLHRMLSNGWLERKGDRVRVAKALKQKLSGGSSVHDVYSPDASNAAAQTHRRISALERVARQTLPSGQPVLSAAQVEAGQHFARDFALGGLGYVATQNYEATGVDGGDRHGRAENALIARMDRRKRVSEAISCLGTGLERAVIAVCCEDWSTEQLERTEKWAKYTGRTVLSLALDRLVDFYGTRPGEYNWRSYGNADSSGNLFGGRGRGQPCNEQALTMPVSKKHAG